MEAKNSDADGAGLPTVCSASGFFVVTYLFEVSEGESLQMRQLRESPVCRVTPQMA
jgi:hypothetical protein